MVNPIRETDETARAMAQNLLMQARFAALGVIGSNGAPVVSRIALARDLEGQPLTLISDLSAHSQALRARAQCSIMVGEPGEKGDPLTHPRMTLQCKATFVARASAVHDELRTLYLTQQPKAKLYIDFGDFQLVLLTVQTGFLNGGFGKAYQLEPSDLSV